MSEEGIKKLFTKEPKYLCPECEEPMFLIGFEDAEDSDVYACTECTHIEFEKHLKGD